MYTLDKKPRQCQYMITIGVSYHHSHEENKKKKQKKNLSLQKHKSTREIKFI